MDETAERPSAAILGHQREAFEKLVAVARAAFYSQRRTLPLRIRTNTLVVGPSGTGKTFLARAVADELGLPFLAISASDWMVLGSAARGAVTTWPSIARFLSKHARKDGVVLFLDEIDKVSGTSMWETFLRTEIFKLLDLDVPSGLCDSEGECLAEHQMQAAREVLADRTFIVAAGAFQAMWESGAKTPIGFSGDPAPPSAVTLDRLSAALPRELVNRFRADVIALPGLAKADYLAMVEKTAPRMPGYLRGTFLRLAAERLDKAVANQQGCRFLEEALLDTIIFERANLAGWKIHGGSREVSCAGLAGMDPGI